MVVRDYSKTKYMGLIILLIGLVFTIIGHIFLKRPPKKINPHYGYRSSRSMKSQASWDKAQGFSANITRNAGLLIMALSIPAWLTSGMELKYVPVEWVVAIPILITVIPTAVILIQTENYLKKNFDDKGEPKQTN